MSNNKYKLPCKDCAVNAPENFSKNFSKMLQPKSACFEMGWHVHKATTELLPDTIFEGGEQYTAFMCDELWEELYGL